MPNHLPFRRLRLAAATLALACPLLLAALTVNTPAGTLDAALKAVRSATSDQIVWNSRTAQSLKVKAHQFKDVSTESALKTLISGLPLAVEKSSTGVYTITAAGGTVPGVRGSVAGRVVDAQGEPIIGATILIKGTDYGVATDLDGNFTLKDLTESQPVLLVRSIGYKPYEEKAKLGTKGLVITLKEDAQVLNEVVVTGYQELSRERATGAFSRVDADELKGKRISSVSDLLEGQVAGMADGSIRGTTSMAGVTTPLYVIDGFPVEKTINNGYSWEEQVPDINVEDIESITVLKDAAAASIYGARAANGVVVITTKKAKQDTQTVTASATLSVQPYAFPKSQWADASTMVGLERDWAAQNPNLQGDGAAAYAQNVLNNASYTTKGIQTILNRYAGNISEAQMNERLAALASAGHRYYDQVGDLTKKNVFRQQYNVAVNKSTGRNNFNASFTYKHNQLEDKNTHDQSFGINIRNIAELAKWLTFDTGVFLNYSDSQTQTFDPLNPGYTIMPYDALVNADGTPWTFAQEDRYAQYQLSTLNNYGLNRMDITPLDEIGRGLIHGKDFSQRLQARLTFKFTSWLKYAASFQYEAGEYKTNQLREKESFYTRDRVNSFATAGADGTVFNLPNGNIYNTASNTLRAYNFRHQIDVNYDFNDDNQLTALLGQEIRENKNTYQTQTLYDYDPQMLSHTLVDANALTSLSGLWGWGSFSTYDIGRMTELKNRFVSFYANASYLFMRRYNLTASIRWDKTNLFATGSKFQKKPIWSVGAAWNIDRERWFPAVWWVNMLKLRASYGIGGNIAKDAAPYLTASYGSNTHVGGQSGNVQSRPNPGLRWEKTTTANVGLDFALLSNRLTGSVEYYYKRGTDLLANNNGVPVEGWGFSTYYFNNGKMTNQGLELTLNATPIQTSDWTWTVGTVMGYNHNNVDYVNCTAPVLFLMFDHPEAYPRIGNPYNSIYGYKWAGLSENGTPQVYDKDGNLCSDMAPQTVDDACYLGSTVPSFTGSLNSALRFKQFELSLQFIWQSGAKMRNTFAPYLSSPAAVSAAIADRWINSGDQAVTDIPAFISQENPLYNYSASSMYLNSDACVVSTNNLRLRNISLAYNVPAQWCKKAYMTGARIMFGIEDLFWIAANSDAKYLMGGFSRPNYVMSLTLNF